MEIYGIRLIGFNEATLAKVWLTLAAVGAVVVVRWAATAVVHLVTRPARLDRARFWARQGISLAGFGLLVIALLSIWFDDPARLGSVVGLAAAGVAIAAQKAVTSFAGYLVVMRGRTFTVGDRIKMGGVRGDVIALGFLQTRILEMGQPQDVNEQETPGMWVGARQFTGRIVTVTNDKIFEEPVYNYTREFPYLWEEMRIPVPFRADRARAERIILDVVTGATGEFVAESERTREELEARYGVPLDRHEPRVFWRITDDWLELSVRFVVPEHGIRDIKDRIAREVLPRLEEAGIEIASATFEITRVPPMRLERARPAQ
jgi:small-conductance mechanosensitive channel